MAGRRRSAWSASAVLPSTSKAASRESPSPSASSSASPRMPITPTSVVLATSFADVPAPTGPRCRTVPNVDSSGSQRSNGSCPPPTKTLSVPASTSATLPSTGESRSPSSGSSAASLEVESGPTVDIWISVAPSPSPATTPSGPSVTSTNARGSATIVITASARRDASAGVSAARAPAATNGSALAGSRFQTTSSCPASTSRRAIRLPIAPSPTTPTAVTKALACRRRFGRAGFARTSVSTRVAKQAPASLPHSAGSRRRSLDPVEQPPVRLEGALRHGGELRPPCGRRLGQRLARGPGVLEVALGVQPEVLGREIVAFEPIVLDEPRELRSRDRRLGRLDRVEDRERRETLVRRPGRGALGGLRRRLPVERRLDGSSELVPQPDVLGLLARVLAVARGGSRLCHGDDRVPVLPGVEGKLVTGQLTALPALVEGVLQDIPAPPRLVDTRAKLHLAPSLE